MIISCLFKERKIMGSFFKQRKVIKAQSFNVIANLKLRIQLFPRKKKIFRDERGIS